MEKIANILQHAKLNKHHARYFDPKVPYHITSKTFQSRFLLSPDQDVNELIAGTIGRAKYKYQSIKLYAYAFMSNHFHLMLQGEPQEISAFVGFIKREISRRIGQKINWPGSMWQEMKVSALPSGKSQVDCLRYILSHGVKEELVASPTSWPGLHSAKEILSGTGQEGIWFDSSAFGKSLRRQTTCKKPRIINKEDYLQHYTLMPEQIPLWSACSVEEYRLIIKGLVDDIVARYQVPEAKLLIAIDNHDIANERRSAFSGKALAKKTVSNQTKENGKMIVWGSVNGAEAKGYLAEYWTFQQQYRQASNAYLAGDKSALFPDGAFLPGIFRRAGPTKEEVA